MSFSPTVGIIVLAHRSPEQVALLLRTLQHHQIRLYLHVDLGTDLGLFRHAIDLPGVHQLPRFRSRWGGIEVVDATLAGIEMAVADGCDYFFLISGQDFPLWDPSRIVTFVAQAPERSYLAHFPLPDPRWRYEGRLRTDFYTYTILGRRETCIPRGEPHVRLNWRGNILNQLLRARSAFQPERRFPSYSRPFGGSQWWNMSKAAAAFVLEFLRNHPEYRAYHEHTLLPDEIFFQSILLGTSFADSHEIVNDHLRFMVWPPGASHPETLTRSHLPALLSADQPFARKFDVGVDHEVVEVLRTARASSKGRS